MGSRGIWQPYTHFTLLGKPALAPDELDPAELSAPADDIATSAMIRYSADLNYGTIVLRFWVQWEVDVSGHHYGVFLMSILAHGSLPVSQSDIQLAAAQLLDDFQARFPLECGGEFDEIRSRVQALREQRKGKVDIQTSLAMLGRIAVDIHATRRKIDQQLQLNEEFAKLRRRLQTEMSRIREEWPQPKVQPGIEVVGKLIHSFCNLEPPKCVDEFTRRCHGQRELLDMLKTVETGFSRRRLY